MRVHRTDKTNYSITGRKIKRNSVGTKGLFIFSYIKIQICALSRGSRHTIVPILLLYALENYTERVGGAGGGPLSAIYLSNILLTNSVNMWFHCS